MNKLEKKILKNQVAIMQWQMNDIILNICALCSSSDILVIQKLKYTKASYCKIDKQCGHENCCFYNYLTYAFDLMQKINYLYQENIVSINRDNVSHYFKKINKEVDKFIDDLSFFHNEIDKVINEKNIFLFNYLKMQLVTLQEKVLKIKKENIR